MKLPSDGWNWRKALKCKNNFSVYALWQTASGIFAIIFSIIILSLIYQNKSSFTNELLLLLNSRILFIGIIILVLNLLLSYFILKKSISQLENTRNVKLIISSMTFIWMVLVMILTGIIWL